MATLVGDDLSPQTADDPRPLRLADGTELLGEFQDSAYETPRYLVQRSDGQVMQLPGLLYRLAGSMDGRTAGQIAADLSAESEHLLTAEQVSLLVDERLRPVGIVASDEPGAAPQERPVKSDPLLGLRYRVGLVPASVSWRVAGLLRFLFVGPVWMVALGASIAVHAWVLFSGDLLDRSLAGVDQLARAPALLLLMYVLQAVSATWHECGHVTACRFGGARPGDMGVGLYLVWPAFYSTVTDSYRLDRKGRLRTDLGGVYFDAIFMAGVGLTYAVTGQPWLLIMLFAMLLETAWQFLPSIRLDGYYILADLVGVPDLFGYLGPTLKSLVPGRPTHVKVAELRPRARRVIVAWVALAVPTLLTFLVAFLIALPHVLPVVRDAFLWHVDALDLSLRRGDVVSTSVGLFELLLLLLPWLGVVLVWLMIWGSLRRAAAGRWTWARARPQAWASVRGVLAATAAAGLAWALVWRVWWVASTAPPGEAETRIAASAVGALLLGRDAAPAVPSGETVVRDQLVAYARLTGAWERHADVLTGARELAVVACAVLVGCLLAVAVMLRWRCRVVLVPLTAVAAMGPAVSTLAALGPGVVGAAWAAVGGALLVAALHPRPRHGRPPGAALRRASTGLGGTALFMAVVTAPVLAVPLAVGASLWLIGRTARPAGRSPWLVSGVGGSCLVALLWTLASTLRAPVALPLTAGEEQLLVVLAGLVSVAGALLRRTRTATAMTLSLLVLAVAPVPGADAVLPVLLCATAALGALVTAAWTPGSAAARPRPVVRAAVAVPIALVVVVGALLLPARAPDLPHRALAQWTSGPGAEVPAPTAPLPVWADLVRDGVPEHRLVPGVAGPTTGSAWAVAVGERAGPPTGPWSSVRATRP